MKIRHDFVTNSSSSSFIIGNADDGQCNVDSVFRIVRNLYREYFRKIDDFRPHINKYHLQIKDSHFEYKKKYSWDKRSQIDRQILQDFGVDTWEWIRDREPWLDFETYAEYQAYWVNRLKAIDREHCYDHAPFSIFDYANPDPDYIPLEDGESELRPDDYVASLNRHLTGWYIPCVDNRLDGTFHQRDWDYCDDCPYAPMYSSKCDKLVSRIDSGEITMLNCTLLLLGKVCVHSECGYIPDSIVNKLADMSNFCFNHMG